jgi:hypothetical protein
MTIRYINETSAKKTGLPIGTPIKLLTQSDPYRILAPLEAFWQVVADASTTPTMYGLTYFETSQIDPLSLAVIGPWIHDGKVKVGVDRLPEGERHHMVTFNKSGTVFSTTTIIVNAGLADEYTTTSIKLLLEDQFEAILPEGTILRTNSLQVSDEIADTNYTIKLP